MEAMVYLGGPIDMVPSGFQSWKDRVKVALERNGMSSFDPAGAFNIGEMGPKVSTHIVHINKYALESCDYAIFYLSPEHPSIGTPIELYSAFQTGLPLVVLWGGDIDHIPSYIQYYSSGNIVQTYEGAVAWIMNHMNARQ